MNKSDLKNLVKDIIKEIEDPTASDGLRLIWARIDAAPSKDYFSNTYSNVASILENIRSNKTNVTHINNQIHALLGETTNLFVPLSTNSSSEIIESLEAELQRIRNDISEEKGEGKKIVDQLQALLGSAEEVKLRLLEKEEALVSHIGFLTDAVKAGEYSESAKSDRKIASWMRNIAAFLFIAAAGFGAWSIMRAVNADPQSLTLPIILAKLSGSLVIALPGLYLAREASRHMKESIRSQRMSHELASLDNYLGDINNEDVRQNVKSALALKYFGRAGEIYQNSDDGVITSGLLEKLFKSASEK